MKSTDCAQDEPTSERPVTACYKGTFVPEFILSILAVIRVFFRSRSDTALEVLALRQQVAVLKRANGRSPVCIGWTGSSGRPSATCGPAGLMSSSS